MLPAVRVHLSSHLLCPAPPSTLFSLHITTRHGSPAVPHASHQYWPMPAMLEASLTGPPSTRLPAAYSMQDCTLAHRCTNLPPACNRDHCESLGVSIAFSSANNYDSLGRRIMFRAAYLRQHTDARIFCETDPGHYTTSFRTTLCTTSRLRVPLATAMNTNKFLNVNMRLSMPSQL